MFKWIISAILAFGLAGAALAQGSDYKIRSGDSLSIEVLEDASLNRVLLVLPDGNVSFPLAGNVKAAGLDLPPI